jgi:hypothetical protein
VEEQLQKVAEQPRQVHRVLDKLQQAVAQRALPPVEAQVPQQRRR